MTMKTALTIAGSDTIGGAGIQADIKTMTMNGVYAMSALTALTAQNTMGVSSIMEATPAFLAEEIDRVFEDVRPDAVKIGMVSHSLLIQTIADRLSFYKAENIVVDPVMVATSGADLMKSEAVQTLKKVLLPLATVITPNIPEAEVLTGRSIKNESDMVRAAIELNTMFPCAVLVKGGHAVNDANDVMCREGQIEWFMGRRIDVPNTHGTGCTLSSAIAANLAKGFDLSRAVKMAKDYLSGALAAGLNLGKGSRLLNHAFTHA